MLGTRPRLGTEAGAANKLANKVGDEPGSSVWPVSGGSGRNNQWIVPLAFDLGVGKIESGRSS